MIKIRIINKAKDGVTLKVKGNTQKMSWEEFNEGYTIKDGVWAIMKPELEERFEKLTKRLDNLVSNIWINNLTIKPSMKLTTMAVIGQEAQAICQEFDMTLAQLMEFIKPKLQALQNDKIFDRKETPEEYRARKERIARQKAEDESYRRSTLSTAKVTLGDHPEFAKLKDKFGK